MVGRPLVARRRRTIFKLARMPRTKADVTGLDLSENFNYNIH